MKNILHSLIAILALLGIFVVQSCSKEKGCMDRNATNYDPTAVVECSSCCVYAPASTTNGNMLFYSTADKMPTIKLSNGVIIVASANTGCTDAHSTNHISMPQGNYTYTATNADNMNWTGSLSIAAGQCTSTGLTTANASTPGKGTVQFSTNNSGLGSITVTMNNNVAGIITPYVYSSTFVGPGFDVSATAGTHTYTAQSANGQKWTGSVDVISGKTTPVSFTRSNMSLPVAGYSNIVFYSTTQSDYSVSLTGKNIGSGIANSSGGTDVCSQSWEVSSVVPFGTYNWSATTLSGKYFSGTVVANLNGCVTVQIM